jgi:hypothetical protein
LNDPQPAHPALKKMRRSEKTDCERERERERENARERERYRRNERERRKRNKRERERESQRERELKRKSSGREVIHLTWCHQELVFGWLQVIRIHFPMECITLLKPSIDRSFWFSHHKTSVCPLLL